jgi:16S rRNA (guanine527-N7)-methyltransferase
MIMAAFRECIEKGAEVMGVPVTWAQVEALVVHAKELLAWNKTSNLTAITDEKVLAEKQFLDVLPMIRHVPFGARMIDIGSGGGFPGLPLKILRPDITVTLIDARRKKAHFLKHAIRTLGLHGAEACHARAEAWQGKKGQKKNILFDVVVSKAVGDLRSLFRIGAPLLERQGRIIAMKGKRIEKELRDIAGMTKRGGFVVEKMPYRLPFSGTERTLVFFKRNAQKNLKGP